MSRTLVLLGDARHLPLPDGSVDAIVTDPPYHLTDMSGGGSPRVPGTGPFGRHRVGERGFMGKTWDGGGVAFDPTTWAEAFRVLRPGGRLLAFGGTRTHHRIWCAIEDAGFVLEDTIGWFYGSGFPKHRSKLKPAWEPVAVARKAHVTPLNVDACRIGLREVRYLTRNASIGYGGSKPQGVVRDGGCGRWPANVVLDDEAARLLDAQSGTLTSGAKQPGRRPDDQRAAWRFPGGRSIADTGSVSRFYYVAKASRRERNEGLPEGTRNHHPTVKPLALMRWLVRLVTPPGGTVLDPFCGSGTTGCAAVLEGFDFIGVDHDPEYVAIARARIAHWTPEQPGLPMEVAV